MKKTRVCHILNIEYPIVQGGMIWVAGSKLAAAVSNEGGLGILAAGSLEPDEVVKEIHRLKEMTSKPYGINIPLANPNAEKFIEIALAEKVLVVQTSAGNPAKFTKLLKESGCKVIHVIPNVKMAKKAEASGVDMVVAEGTEAGGHNGLDEITTMALVPQVVDAVKIPVIAAGGIADGRGVVAAFALGAEGVQIGTRFVATLESIAHENWKNAIVNAGDSDTVLTGRKIGPVRVIKNKLVNQIMNLEGAGASPEDLLKFIGHGKTKAAAQGDVENGSVMSGQIAGLIKDIISVKEVFQRILQEEEAVRQNL